MNPVISLTLLQLLLGTTGIVVFSLQIRSKRQLKSKKRILELENEMLSCHSQILELQRQISQQEKPVSAAENNFLYKHTG